MAGTHVLESPAAEPVDDANHNLVHALSVRLDARWHDRSYPADTDCSGCAALFGRLEELDAQAIRLLTAELARHVKVGKFPLDLAD